jgi:CheY-like chemotaxis protein
LDHNVSVETDLSKDISAVEVDTAQLQMVLSALLINSNEAIGGEGRIRITLKNEALGEELVEQHPGFRPGPYVCLQVEDNGKGMDEETRAKIFDPFYTTKFQGRGMGMAAVYGIVQNHSGLIRVESELGKGTVVRIWLPVSKVPVQESEPAGTETVIGTGTILIIEDEEVVIDVTKAMLERLGYRVMVAKTGRDAVHITETFDGRIDLALLDIKLPDMGGGKVYPLIMEALPDLKVIVCSGYAIDGPAREILDAGAQGFLQKPVSVSRLSEKVKTVLENNP